MPRRLTSLVLLLLWVLPAGAADAPRGSGQGPASLLVRRAHAQPGKALGGQGREGAEEQKSQAQERQGRPRVSGR